MTSALNHASNRSQPPPRRAIFLGASNVTRGLATVLEVAGRVWDGPLEVLAAIGHGRSYGLRMGILGHRLPGIEECGLWPALQDRPPAPTAALVTDIGNDLLYDVAVPQIAGWVEACVDRLQSAGTRVVLTALPLCNLATLAPARFLALRTVLFPGCRLSLATVRHRAEELDERLRLLAKGRGLHLAEHQPDWYGFDPIHILRRHWPTAWHAILSPWSDAVRSHAAIRVSWRRRLYLLQLRPEQRWLLGWEQRRQQPAGALEDGTTLAFY
jgi:hypothetical protein